MGFFFFFMTFAALHGELGIAVRGDCSFGVPVTLGIPPLEHTSGILGSKHFVFGLGFLHLVLFFFSPSKCHVPHWFSLD